MNPTPTTPPLCSTCAAPLPPGTDRCARCGTLHGEHRRCEACGAKAEVVPKSGIYVCAACGRPRIPMELPAAKTSGAEREALSRVADAQRDALLAKIAGIGAGVIDAVLWSFALLAFLAGFGTLSLAASLVALVIAFAVGWAFVTASKARQRAAVAMQDALGQAALELMRARGPITARELGEQMGIAEGVAERVLDRLPARVDVRVDTVLDDRAMDGKVRYRIADPTLPSNVRAMEEAQLLEQASFDERLRLAMQQKGKS